MRKEHLFNSLIVILTIGICFLILEVILKFTIYSSKEYKKSHGTDSRYEINTTEYKTIISINSLGIRNSEIYPKREGEYRILCLGDSFTFGLGVNDDSAYPKVLERILKKEDEKFSVINCGGQPYAGTCYNLLLNKGLELKPDLVVLQVFIGNDFYDAIYGSASQKGLTGELPKGKVAEYCRTIDFLWNRLIQIRYIDDILFKLNLRYGNRGIFLREYPKLEKGAVDLELEYLQKIHKLCISEGIGVVLIVIPSKAQFFKKDFLYNSKYNYKKPNNILKEFCKENDIYYIDFLDKYEIMPRNKVENFYYTRDLHWTASGHKHAALELSSFILAHFAATPKEPST